MNPRPLSRLLLVAQFLLLLFASHAALGATVTWTGSGGNLLWSTPANWSGGAVPPAGSDVVIGVVSGNPTIQFTAAAGVAQINSLNTSQPLNITGGTLQVATTIQSSQNITLAGGTIKDGTVTATGGAVLTASAGTLDGVTLGADLTVTNLGSLYVKNGLALNNAKLIIASSANTYNQNIYFQGTQTLSGTGEVVFGGSSTGNYVYAQGGGTLATAAVLTIGSGILVHGSQSGYLQGQYSFDSINNLGTINADTSGKTISLAGNWSGLGTAKVQNGGILALTGTLDNTGKILDFGAGLGPLTLQSGGTIKGGTITVSGGAGLLVSSGTLDGVILGSDLTVTNLGSLYVKNGLALNNAKLIIASSANTYNQNIYFQGTQTLSGTGEVVFGGSSTGNYVYAQGGGTLATAAVLTIGSGILVHGSQSGYLQGQYSFDSINNLGTINADTSGKTISLAGNWSGLGTAKVQNGGILALTGTLDNTGKILDFGAGLGPLTLQSGGTIKGGTITVSGGAGLLVSSGTLDGVILGSDLTVTNLGSLYVKNGLALNNAKLIIASSANTYNQNIYFQGTQTLSGTGEVVFGGSSTGNYVYAQGGGTLATAAVLTIGSGILVHGSQSGYLQGQYSFDSINNLGTINADTSGKTISLAGNWSGLGTAKVQNGGILALTGTLDNTGKILDFGAGLGPLTLQSGGTIKGGTITVSGGAGLLVSSGTLDGVILGSDLTVTNLGSLYVKNGLALNNAKLIIASSANTYNQNIYFQGTQTLSGTGEVVFGGSSTGNYVYAQGGGTLATAAVLTIGSGILVHGSQSGYLQGQYSFDSINNLGTINADTSGKTISLAGNWSGLGTAKVQNGGILALTGTLDNTGKILDFGAGLGPLTLQSGGTIKGGTITVSGGAGLLLISGGTLDGVTLGSDLTVTNGGSVTVKNGLTLNNAKLTLASASVYFNGTQTLGGTGEVVFGGPSASNYVYAQGGGTLATAAVLTIGSGITVHGSQGGSLQGKYNFESIINQGTINADTSGVTLTVGAGGTWINSGTLRCSNGGFLSISGTLDNTGKTLSLSATNGPVVLDGPGTIKGGTISVAMSGPFPPFVAGKFGTALQFDGTTNYASFGNPADQHLDLGTNATIETWVRFTSLPASGSLATFIGKDVGTGSKDKWIFGYDNGYAGASALVFHINTSGSGLSWTHSNGWTPVVGQWYHVALAKAGTSYTFYIDGVAAGTSSSTLSVPVVASNLQMGGAEGTFRLAGTLDDARMWNVTRTAAEISANMNQELAGNEAGLAGYWKFNEAKGTMLGDSTTGSAIGTVNGTVPALFSVGTSWFITLDGVTLGSDMTVPDGGGLMVKNGLTLNNAKVILASGVRWSTAPSLYELAYVWFDGTQTLDGTGEVFFAGADSGSPSLGNFVYARGGGTLATAAVLTLGSGITVHGSQGGGLQGSSSFDSVSNQGTINADTSGKTITLRGAGFTNLGTVGASNGGTLAAQGLLTLNSQGVLNIAATSNLELSGNLLGNTTAAGVSNSQGWTILDRGGAQLLEAMSQDLGNVPAGFSQNFAFGTLALANNTYVQLVDQSDNAPGAGAEAVYANSVIVPAGCTLDLNGLPLYARAVQVAGTLLNGTINQLPDSGALTLAASTPGSISIAGELDEWTFFGRAGKLMSILVNPGSGGSPAPVSPQLQWANVQLLDSNGNVLASATNATAGTLVTLANVVLPADGTYKIHINAPAAHTAATGNYIVGAWNVTPNVQSLNIGQQSTGNLATQFALDQWNFSATAGQQVQFHLVGSSSSGVAFQLIGPGNYICFQDITGDSPLINLPASGSYTLSAYGLSGATGTYSFVMRQTSITPLALGTPYTGTWVGSGQAQLFSIPVGTTNPLSVVLSDLDTRNHTEIYARFGAAPTRLAYGYAASGAGSSHSLLVPSATAGTWYVLVYGESIPGASGNFTLQATSSGVVLTGISTSKIASNANTTLTVTGAGFNAGSTVSLVASDGTVYPATSSTTDLRTQMTATFAAGSVPAGTYSIKVTQADGSSAQIPSAVTVLAGQGVLTTSIDVPNPIGRHVAATLFINYSNTGSAPMPAPLLILNATNPAGLQGAYFTLDRALQTAGYWTSATPAGFSNSIQILGSGATPGVLAPGESGRVPVYYAGWNFAQWDFTHPALNFSLTSIKADDTTAVNWASMEASMRPAAIPAAAWHVMYASLLSQLGTTSGGFVQLLDNQASYLSRLGQPVTDVGSLWSFAVAQTENIWPLPTLGGTVDDSLPVPGAVSLGFGRAFNQTIPGRFASGPLGLGWFTPWQQNVSVATDGTVTLITGSGGRSIYQPDSRYPTQYFSQPGDHNTLIAVLGGYQLTAVNGSITVFNNDGTLKCVQDTNGNKITAAYTTGRLATLTATSGQSLTLGYNAAGLISTITDSAGRQTTYTYDAGNQHLMSVTGYNGKTTAYAYNTTAGAPAENALASITFPDGTHQYFTHDSQGRLASTYADGNTMTKTFAYSAGQVSITDATPATSSLYFDQNGQLGKTVDALGNPTYFSHDSKFNLVSVTNALGASASYSYNSAGQATSATDFLGNTTNLVYGGPQSRLSALTDAAANTTLYTYSATGNLLNTTFANGRSESVTYDPLGNALSFVNAAGEPIQYARNAAGQLTSTLFPDGSSYTYTYDSQGRLKTAVDAGGTVTFAYEAVTGFLQSVAYPNGTSLTFGYDIGGRRSSMVDQNGFTTSYVYDAAGRLYQLKDGGNTVLVTYLYDANGRLQQKTNGNGTYTTYQYDANGSVLHLINFAPGGTVNSRFDDTYNSLGLKSGEATLDGAWAYTYDADGQLTHAVFTSNDPATIPDQDLAYIYDPLGNRTSTVINGVTTAYVPNNMNQYTSVGGTPYSYDAKGNLLSDGANTYAYNVLNKLVGVTNGSDTTTYAYNALGQRISSSAAGQTTQYLMDPAGLGNVAATYDGGGSLIAHYTHGLGLVNQITSGATYAYDFDPLGSTVGMSNSAGAYANKYSYLPFGSVLSDSPAVPNVFQFVGQFGVQQEPTGQIFMRARFYSPAASHFITSDPERLSGGDLNLYRYCSNCPVGLIDFVGTSSQSAKAFFDREELWGAVIGWSSANAGVASHIISTIPEKVAELEKAGKVFKEINRYGDYLGLFFGGFDLAKAIDERKGLDALHAIGEIGFGVASILIPATGPVGWILVGAEYLAAFSDFSPHLFGNSVLVIPGGTNGANTTINTVVPKDPNALYGPAGYGASNFVTDIGDAFAYRITFENDATATAPAQSVTVTNNLDANLDWTTFQLTGIGFADNNLNIPAGSQHYQTTLAMTYNGQTFNVQMEAGIHSATGQVYASFYSIDPNTGLPPSSALTGFLPPEDGTGRGQGYLNYSVSPKATVPTGVVIPNVAVVTFDAGESIATNQVNEHNPALGTDPAKEARVTIDANVPTSQMNPLPATVPASFPVSWTGSGGTGGSGLAGFTVYVSSDGGTTYSPWLANTAQTSGSFTGIIGKTYSFYVVATSNVGTVQQVNPQTAAVSTLVGTPVTVVTTAFPLAGGSTSGGGVFNSGDPVALKATPNPGYTFVNWTEGGVEKSKSANYNFPASGNQSLVANFTTTGSPTIAITGLPAYGTTGQITGTVTGVDFTQYQVVTYLFVDGSGWWAKPTQSTPAVPKPAPVDANGNFTADLTASSGGSDNVAVIFCAALIATSNTPQTATAAPRVPADPNFVAITYKERYGRIISFAGRTWAVKKSLSPVGPSVPSTPINYFSDQASDVWVDSAGLHLTIHQINGVWYSTEVILQDNLGYGTYAFKTNSRTDTMDQNAVLGIFTWDPYGDDVNLPTWPYREIDIEDSRWGIPGGKSTQYVVQYDPRNDPPNYVRGNRYQFNLPDLSTNAALTRTFNWQPGYADFVTLSGDQPSSVYLAAPSDFTYSTDAAVNHYVPGSGRENIHMNLWLNNATGPAAPSDGQPVEVVITGFEFTPLFPVTIATSAAPTAGGTTSGGGTFNSGASVTVLATPNANYAFVNWTDGSGAVVSTTTSYTFNASANATLTANFVPTYLIATSSAPAAGGTTSGGGTFNSGASVTVMATPNANYAFVNWTDGSGAAVSTTASYTFTASANVTLTANFVPTYLIATSSSPAAGGTTSGGGTFNSGTSVTVLATPNANYAFVNWTDGSGTAVSTTPSYTFNASANATLTANFVPTYSIATSSAPAAGGTTSGGGTFNSGASVTVLATPNANYAFVNWTDGSGTAVSTTPSYTFSASANAALVANFVPTYSIATSSSLAAGGTTSGGGTFNSGTSVTVMATANAGYSFVNWTEGGIQVSTTPSYTFTAGVNRTLVANFAVITYTITTNASPIAGGTTNGGGTVNFGSSVSVGAMANAGYNFVNWTEGGSQVSATASYTFTASANRTLVANFALITYTVTPAAGANGTINPSTAQPVNSGGSAAFTATPSSGFVVDQWLVNGAVVQTGGVTYTVSNVTADTTLRVTFTAASNRTGLAALVLNAGTLAPAFANATTSYTAIVPNATASVTVTPLVADSAATIKINGVVSPSGAPSRSLPLTVGANPISITVTAPNRAFKTYTVVVNRERLPWVTVLSPPNGTTLPLVSQAGSVTVRGLAKGDVNVTQVMVALNGGAAVQANVVQGTRPRDPESWDLVVSPENGNNVLKITAIDMDGNVSMEKIVRFGYQVSRPMLGGTYQGLATPTVASTTPALNVGLAKVSVLPTGAFTGTLVRGGSAAPLRFSATFGVLGDARFLVNGQIAPALPVTRKKEAKPLFLALHLDVSGGTKQITGTLSESAPNGTVVSNLTLDQRVYTRKTPVPPDVLNPATNKGAYTGILQALLPADQGLGADEYPQGDGWALVKVASAGPVSVIGQLADGKPFTYRNYLSKDKTLPLYLMPYGGTGTVSGQVNFDASAAQTDVSGPGLRWFKPANPRDSAYPLGWQDGAKINGIKVDFLGSKFVSPLAGKTLLGNTPAATSNSANALLALIDGWLPTELSNNLSINVANHVTVLGPPSGGTSAANLKLILSGNGRFSGRFEQYPPSIRTVNFFGVILQKTGTGSGYFLGRPATGSPAGTPQQSSAVTISAQ